MAKAKGIRVNQLAKELGIPSKAILDRCKTEGLGDKVPNHMSLMSLGLAQTVREWFPGSGGGVATAVETATEEAVTEAHIKPSRRRKKTDEHGEEEPESVDQTEAEHVTAHEPSVEEAVVAPTQAVEPMAEEPMAVAAPTAGMTPEPAELPEEPAVPIEPTAEVAPAPAATPEVVLPPEVPVMPPAAMTPAVVAHVKPTAPSGGGERPEGRQLKPTITLADRTTKPARAPVTPAPRLMTPAPAKIQGPRIVREEKPDVVSAPRRRVLGGEGASGPAFVQARPQAGRGVKTSTSDEETEEVVEGKKKPGKGGRTLSSRRRGPDGRRGEAMEKLKEYTEADLIELRDRLAAASSYRAGFDSDLKKKSERGQHQLAKSAAERGGAVEIQEPVTVRDLSAVLGIKSNDLIMKLMRQGIMAGVNKTLDRAVAESLALTYGVELKVVQEASLEEQLERDLASEEPEAPELTARPPVVTILGHVDHGKTSLLDKIRKANVAAGEAGGITQHIAAWMVQLGQKRVTFIDTPGHQAFTSMRARGATMTDVVVLVVSAAEGVQPQTIESINHARAAEVPIVVAMNKIDRPDANEQQVLGQLAAQGLNPVEWGGDTEVVRTSAVTGKGIQELIEILDYQAELLELKANNAAPAKGTVIEATMEEGLGTVATVLVQDGTLRVGDIILSGGGYGRVRSLTSDRGESIQEAGPATPVIVSGLSDLPSAGDKFYILDDMERARAIAEERKGLQRQAQLGGQNKVTAEDLLAHIKAGEIQTINLIIKADAQGSVETLVKTVGGQNTEEVKVRVVHAGVGPVSESDVELAMATKTKATDNKVAIIGFHVDVEDAARALGEQHHIDIKIYRVIYEIFDDIKKALSGMLTPEEREKLHGHAEVRQVFKVSRMGNIAGCLVTDGHIQRGSKIRLIRNGSIIVSDLALESLKRMKDDVKEVKSGLECGLKIAGYDDIKVGDRFEAYSRETIQRTL